MLAILRITVAVAALATSASAATLTITPDKSTYRVGETITLSVLGDAQGGATAKIMGSLLFDPLLAEHVGSSQQPLTSFDGGLTWSTGTLAGGPGLADAFLQIGGANPTPVDGPLFASVALRAVAAGALDYAWLTIDDDPVDGLAFFGLTSAPGGSVTIVPEPATGLLVGLGLITIALNSKRPS